MRRWLILSLLVNALMIFAATGLIAYKGGWQWLIGLSRPAQPAYFSQTALYQGRVDSFQKTPVASGAWVFLGDSLTDYAPTQELFGSLTLNRGIAGDLVADMAKRASEISRHTPSAIVLWGGTNDLLAGLSCDAVVQQTLSLASRLKNSSPQARVIILGPPPVAERLAENPQGFRAMIECVNKKMAERVSEIDAAFHNPASALADSSGELRSEYSFDGIHLNGNGYRTWSAWLQPMLPQQGHHR
jgi:lysophospholipase L1-like esterase